MNNVLINQFLIFTLVTIVVAAVLLGLFRLRFRFGLTPLYITLGVFQPIQVVLASSIYAKILPGIVVSPGSVIMFTATLFAILLIYIREDAIEARKAIYGIMFANLTMSLLMIIFGLQLRLPDTLNFLSLSPGIFNQNVRITIAGTIALFADVLLIIFVYEAIWRWVTKHHFLCIYLTMALVLVFDTLVFATGAFFGQANYLSILTSGIIGKIVMAVPFAFTMTLYLYYGEPAKRVPQTFEDIFNTLSYRQKFEIARRRSEIAEQGLQRSEDRFQQLFHHSPVPIWEEDFSKLFNYLNEIRERGVHDFRAYLEDNPAELQVLATKVKIKDINQETLRLHNAKNKEELLGNLDKIFADTSYDTFKEEIIALAEGKLHFETEGQVKTLGGEIRDIYLKLHIQKDSRIALLATTDITERKRVEKMLRKSEELYRSIVEYTPVLICSFLPDSEVTFVNKAYSNFFNIDPEDIIGSSFLSFIPEQDHESVMANIHALRPDSPSLVHEHQVVTTKGEIRWQKWLNHGFFDTQGNALEYQSIGEDITDRKHAEEKLLESEERFRLLVENIKEVFWVFDFQDQKVKYVSPAYDEVWGRSRKDLLTDYGEWSQSIHPDDLEYANESFQKTLATGGGESREYRIIRPDGEVRWLSDRGFTVCEEDGTVNYVVGVAEDITERKQIQNNIIEERNKLEAFLAALNDGITVQDTNFTILYQNDLHRKKQGDHIGEFCYQAFHNREDICPGCLLVECFNDGGVHRRETSAVTDKGIVHMEVSASPIKDAGGNIVAAVETIRDITDKKKLESQLIQTQKMESVGLLAGGVAHDFNNMLSVILGYTEFAIEKTTPNDPIYEDLQEIFSAARRSTDITRQLLAFARKQTIKPQVMDLNETIEGMLKMLRRLIGEDIDVAWLPGGEHFPIFMDPSQLDQILANLCVNARDAIGGVGKLTIETDKVYLDENYCAERPGFTPGNFVMLTVSDNGCGMEKDMLNKIFEPFFTTKGLAEGTGLGLSTVYGIVKQNYGFINAYSEPGEGSTFKIYLPRHVDEIRQSEERDDTQLPQSRGETVLIVEDEVSILKLAKRILLSSGYKVLDADKPGQAINLAEKHEDTIDLLITDVIMPGMNGRELAEKLNRIFPDIKILYMSGYTANVIAHRGVLDEDVEFIQKPFSNRDLSSKVRKVLDEMDV